MTDPTEHDAVQQLAGVEAWIGGIDLPSQVFRWITGEPFDTTHFAADQPDGGDLENCLATTSLPPAECGHDIVEPGEECDDGAQGGRRLRGRLQAHLRFGLGRATGRRQRQPLLHRSTKASTSRPRACAVVRSTARWRPC